MMTLEDWARRSNMEQHAADIERALFFGNVSLMSRDTPLRPPTLRQRFSAVFNEATYRISLAWKALCGVDLREDTGDY